MIKKLFLFFIFLLCLSTLVFAQERGVLNKQAPSWNVDDWYRINGIQETVDVSDYEGRVLYLYCFQSWCPGCHSSGFPTLKKLVEHYEGDEGVAFVAIQTTFEGFHTNTFSRAKEVIHQYDLDIPVGQSGDNERISKVMKSYRTGGTPWTIIIDKEGIVRYNDFHIKSQKAIKLIDSIK